MTVTLDAAPMVVFASRALRRIPGARAAIGTDRSDMLTVTAPPDATEASLKRLVGHHYPAIARWIQQGSAADAWAPIARQFVGGEGFLLDGRSARLRLDDAQQPGVAQFERDGFGCWLHVNRGDDPEAVLRAIVDCYAALSRERVRNATKRLAPRFGLRFALDVRGHERDRDWISTRLAKDVLRVQAHWALAQFTAPTLEYLVARTLASRTEARVSLAAVVPCPEQPRRRLHHEAPEVWTGDLAP